MLQKTILDIIKSKFTSAIEVSINDEIYNACENFANKVNPTTKYNDCGQNDMNKRLIDNLIGKIAEFGTYGILNSIAKENGFTINQPDVLIYKGKKKSWKSDLIIEADDGDINIAVKAQSLSQAMKYSLSGTFQAASFRKDKVLDSTDEIIFLCMVNDTNYRKVLVLPPKTIGEIKFGDPKLFKFKGIKICYYAKDNFAEEDIKGWLTDFGVEKFGSII